MSAATPLESEAQRNTVSVGHRVAAAGDGLAIALGEADLAVLDHGDGEADHRGILHQLLDARVEPRIIDRRRLARRAPRHGEVEAGSRLGCGTSAGRVSFRLAAQIRPTSPSPSSRKVKKRLKDTYSAIPLPPPGSHFRAGVRRSIARELRKDSKHPGLRASLDSARLPATFGCDAGEGAPDRAGLLRGDQPRRLHARRHQGGLAPRQGEPGLPSPARPTAAAASPSISTCCGASARGRHRAARAGRHPRRRERGRHQRHLPRPGHRHRRARSIRSPTCGSKRPTSTGCSTPRSTRSRASPRTSRCPSPGCSRRGSGTVDETVEPEHRAEVRAKLAHFVRAKLVRRRSAAPASPACCSTRSTRWTRRPHGGPLLPAYQPLDLFVTVTDFRGYPEALRLNSPPEVIEREHRITLAFQDPPGPRSGFADPIELTFAARATASFPGAFPPFQVKELDAVLEKRGRPWPGRDASSPAPPAPGGARRRRECGPDRRLGARQRARSALHRARSTSGRRGARSTAASSISTPSRA